MSSATQPLDSLSGEQRPFRRGRVGSGVEELQERITALVQQRQQLRMSGASRASLERNRLQLVRSQWELCHALIEQHLPQATEAARPDGRGDSQGVSTEAVRRDSSLVLSHDPPRPAIRAYRH